MSSYGESALRQACDAVRSARIGSRNDELFKQGAAMWGLVASGFLEDDEVRELLHEAAEIAFQRGEYRSRSDTLQEIRQTLSQARKRGMSQPRAGAESFRNRADARSAVASARESFLRIPFDGRTGKRITPVFLALCDIAEQQGGPRSIAASQTKLRVLAGQSCVKITRRALRELQDLGLIRRCTAATRSSSTQYDLVLDVQSTPTPHPTPDSGSGGVHAQFGHDAFHADGLNVTGLRILIALHRASPDWLSQTAVARSTGLCASTVSRHVRADWPLVHDGLVERNDRGAVRSGAAVTQDLLDQIAARLGTAGRGNQRREREADRLRRDGYLDTDNVWIDQRTGDPTGRSADWLEATSNPYLTSEVS